MLKNRQNESDLYKLLATDEAFKATMQKTHILRAYNTIKTQWVARGFSCEVWVDTPGARWEDFVHEVDEVVRVLEGDVEFEIDGKAFHPTIGEELLIPAHVRHSVRNIGHGMSRWLYGYQNTLRNS